MVFRKISVKSPSDRKYLQLLEVAFILVFGAAAVWAQVTASITGTVRDTSGAIVPGASVTIKDTETGTTRTAETQADGRYSVPSLSVGQYEVTAEKAGFKQQVRRGITLVVGQQAVVNLTLEVGNVEQQVTVTAETSLVNTTLSPTSGLVGEQQVKDLPLNGRSFDLLMALNVGTANYSAESRGGNVFSVAGRREEENRFLMNGVDFIGGSGGGLRYTPNGLSGDLLGVDAVREFNVVQNTYGAEYGKRPGGQVTIVTNSGTNQLHGTAFEFLRNSDLDARGFFDFPLGTRIPPLKRNQFGGSLGGPLKKDKLFLFGNYEEVKLTLGLSDVDVVPDLQARQGYLPNAAGVPTLVSNLKTGMLPFFAWWPLPNGSELLANGLPNGTAYSYTNPVENIREEFGVIRFDYNVSAKDLFSGNYLIDDGNSYVPAADPNFVGETGQRAHVLSVQETHIFSPTVLNVVTLGFSRAFNGMVSKSITPIPANLQFLAGQTAPASIAIGGGTGTTGLSPITSPTNNAWYWGLATFFTWADDVHLTKGAHSLSAGVWIQRVQASTDVAQVGSSGAVSYPTLTAFLQDAPTLFQAIPNPQLLGYRSTEAAWYVQDEIKLKSNLTLRLGLRDEMTTGWNEAHGRCSNYVFDSTTGVMQTNPLVGNSCLSQNNAVALWQPRVGLAWDPTGTGTWAVRAGVGIFNALQDDLQFRLISNPPYGGRETSTAPLLSIIPVPAGTQPPPACNAQLQAANQPCTIYNPAGIEPNMHTPTVQEWSLTIEREITKDLMFQLGYVGSQSYHEIVSVDENTVPPQVCAAPQGCASGGVNGNKATVPQGTTYVPAGTRPNPYLSTSSSWWFDGNSSYEGLTASLVKRVSHGLSFKTNYTFAKTLDMNSGVTSGLAANSPQAILDRFNMGLNKGLAGFDLEHQFNISYSYELPFGRGQRWGGGSSGLTDRLIGGWQWNGIFTAQSGFPFTPVVGSNISGTGDTTNPDTPNRNPAFSGPVILGKVNQWFNPNAFLIPTAGTFGNVARGSYIGPGLTEFDTSLFKKIAINERWKLEFRAEGFNIFNHANFLSPNPTVFSGSSISASAGVITKVATTSRQLQFALKMTF